MLWKKEDEAMQIRIIDEEIKLVPYYPNYATALEWYQDVDLCKQVDNRDAVYDLPLLRLTDIIRTRF